MSGDARRLETLAVHVGNEPDPATGAMAPPIHLATTFRHGPAGERVAGHEYQRESHPTRERLEAALCALEGGEAALGCASGMAAITVLLESLGNGARILIPDDCYTGLRVLAREYLPERGIVAQTIDLAPFSAWLVMR